MNYREIYLALCKRAKDRFPNCTFIDSRSEKYNLCKLFGYDYLECHHIIPVSDGGEWVPSNLCYLTAREHIIAHHLLFKSDKSKNHFQSFHYQIYCNKSNTKFNLTTKEISILKELNSKYCSERIKKSNETINKFGLKYGLGNSCYGKHWYTDGVNNIHLSDGDGVPEEYHKGRTYNKGAFKNCHSTKGRSWYTNGVTNKMFYQNDIIPEGYYKGMTR